MDQTVRLTVLTGPHKGHRVCVRGMQRCGIGRGEGNTLQFCGHPRDLTISRSHCELLVDAPRVLLHDLHSANGTYLNGSRVGSSPSSELVAELFQAAPDLASVEPGSIITVGGTSVQVDLMECPTCTTENPQALLWADGESVKQDCPERC